MAKKSDRNIEILMKVCYSRRFKASQVWRCNNPVNCARLSDGRDCRERGGLLNTNNNKYSCNIRISDEYQNLKSTITSFVADLCFYAFTQFSVLCPLSIYTIYYTQFCQLTVDTSIFIKVVLDCIYLPPFLVRPYKCEGSHW